ncbi:LLM class F420-dependent oxidoreductase [Georgenia sp. SYP-B2076]|uniref:LLM class F420-dependent oxidoreductase n=1 Tax=Georgenia sp. SYP-B2076 TaxID=2495881 RepID=UPI000F8F1483|nr:LLM class F420-dependent oxidoreductase [Georgenia sp. SYP-B2076]
MQLASMLEYAGDPRKAAAQVTEREAAGIDIVWVSEAYGYDAPTMLGYLAGQTRTVQLGPGILNVYSRTPAAIAQTVAGLDNVSGGRAILGIGASGPQVIEGFHGVSYRNPLGKVRDVVATVRQVLRREAPLELDGATVTIPLPPEQGTGLGKPLKLINHPERPAVPIYLASLGPKSIAMAAEIADGWLPALWIPELAPAVYSESLSVGRAQRDPVLGELDIACGGIVAIAEGEERERLLWKARQQVALYVGGMGARGKNFYNDVFVKYGYGDAARTIQDLYLAGRKDEAAAAVPAEAVERLHLVGSESFIKERIAAFNESGVSVLNVYLGQPDLDLVTKVKSWLPA